MQEKVNNTTVNACTVTPVILTLNDTSDNNTTTTANNHHNNSAPSIVSSIAPQPPPPDIVQQVCGNFGHWQLRTILLIFLCKIPSAWFMACIIYTAPTPKKGDYYCRPPALMNLSSGPSTDNTPAWVRMSHPVSDERGTDRRFYLDACNIYEEQLQRDFVASHANYTNPFEQPDVVRQADGSLKLKVNVLPCEHFEHNSDYISLVSQFDLVCSRQLLISVTQSFHGLGAFIGGLVARHALKQLSAILNQFILRIFWFCT